MSHKLELSCSKNKRSFLACLSERQPTYNFAMFIKNITALLLFTTLSLHLAEGVLPWSVSTATDAAYLSSAAYCKPETIADWTCLRCLDRNFKYVGSVYDAPTQTFGFVGYSRNISTCSIVLFQHYTVALTTQE